MGSFKRALSIFMACIIFMTLFSVGDFSKVYAANTSNEKVLFQGHTYKVYDLVISWQDAKKYCEELGGHLVAITSQEEQNAIESLISLSLKNAYWLGATDERVDGTWEWVTGEKWSFANWAHSQPDDNGYGNEDYLGIARIDRDYANKNEWNDYKGSDVEEGSMGFICEWDKDTTKDNNEITYMEELSPVNHDRYVGNEGDSFIDIIGRRNGNVDVQGNSYIHGLTAWVARWNYTNEISWVWNEYDLDKKFQFLQGKIVLIKSYNENNFSTQFEIIGDGKTLYSAVLTPSDLPSAELKVNVTGISKLTIKFQDKQSVSGGTAFGLANFRLSTGSTTTSNPIRVVLNRDPLIFDQQPVIENGRTLVPLRAIFEAMDATIDWNGTTQTITATRNGKTILLKVGNTQAKIGERTYTLDTPPKVLNGRTLVPVRFVAESFDAYVYWDGKTQTVEITDNQKAYLTARVKAYCSEYDAAKVNTVLNSTKSDEEKYRELADILNDYHLNDNLSLQGLLTSDMYVAYQFKKYLAGNKPASVLLGVGNFVFNDGIVDHIVSSPEKDKYKQMLVTYMKNTAEENQADYKASEWMDLFSKIMGEVTSKDLAKTVESKTALDTIQANLKYFNNPNKTLDGVTERIKILLEQEKILQNNGIYVDSMKSVDSNAYKALEANYFKANKISTALDNVAYVIDLATAGFDAYGNLVDVYSLSSTYEDYKVVFDLIQERSHNTYLVQAAKELSDELADKTTAIYNETHKLLGKTIVSTAGLVYGISELSTITSALGNLSTSVSLGIVIGKLAANAGLGVGDMIDAAVSTIGCAEISELLKAKVVECKNSYNKLYGSNFNSVYELANTFKVYYSHLQQMRLLGEKSYLEMRSFDGALLKDALKSWTNSKSAEEFCNDNKVRLEGYAFH